MSISCPYLNADELCSIYETRPSCCRNFPNRNTGMFCSETKCVYDALGNLDCANCKDKCCKHLEMSVKWKGEKLGVLEMRRHYGNYFKGIPDFKSHRIKLVTKDDVAAVYDALDEIQVTFG